MQNNKQNSLLKQNIVNRPPRAASGHAAQKVVLSILALLVVAAAFAASYHFHVDATTRADCTICKSANDLSAGNSHQTVSLVRQEVFLTSSPINPITAVYTVYIDLKSTRAPPL